MDKSSSNNLYVEGQNPVLDEKFAAYKKMNIWGGYGISGALIDDEVDRIIDLWKKEKRCPWKLTIHEVSMLVTWFSFYFFWFEAGREPKR